MKTAIKTTKYDIHTNTTGAPMGMSVCLTEDKAAEYFSAGPRPVVKLGHVARLAHTCFCLNFNYDLDVFLVPAA
jgi:hypothetical protein